LPKRNAIVYGSLSRWLDRVFFVDLQAGKV
jgi:hypothetical protein